MKRQTWEKRIGSEIAWWDRWLKTRGLDWPEQYAERCDPHAELSGVITKHLGPARCIDVLDVGSGPLTSLGKKWKGHDVRIVACDALADRYRELSFPQGLPLVEVMQCDSETLTDKFKRERFDLVHARNTLDHGYDPMEAIRQMIRVAKIGAIIVLDHHPREATKAHHDGLHQFDFYIEGGRLKIDSLERQWDVFGELGNDVAVDVVEVLGDSQCFVVLRRVVPGRDG